jgi:uncharacterized protein
MVSNYAKTEAGAAGWKNALTVAVTGTHGLVGSVLADTLRQAGHRVRPLVRKSGAADDTIYWDPAGASIDKDQLEGIDVLIHLAGDSIASGRWTEEKKKLIRDSRVRGTKLLADTLARLKNPPASFICASAIGYYGVTGDKEVDESGPPGNNFLAEVCREWEAAARNASDKGVRVVNLRTGMVLSKNGGALAQMLPVFKLGGGGILGNGTQYMSWIGLDDVVGAIVHILKERSLNGPVNIVAPLSVTNKEFTSAMGRVLHRPTVLPLPAFAARLMFGQMADELLLASTRVKPAKLINSSYAFLAADLDAALKQALT